MIALVEASPTPYKALSDLIIEIHKIALSTFRTLLVSSCYPCLG
jgi:hypothetical protein